ncbi:MAG TPA: dihydropteroate synthase [Candidatus Manganitrophaceae bacterium]|nr:dihydropteroate synthase [Candidatus Manganitrophaceae bacterium]
MAKQLQKKEVSRQREASFVLRSKPTGVWHCGPYRLNYRKRPQLMGILNVTPDSFSDGGRFFDVQKAIDQAVRMEEAGADLIDIGGESTRPGASPVSLEEESRRVLPVIEKLALRVKVPLSIDTTKSEVAKRAIEAGASIINDVSGFTRDPEMFPVAATGKAGLVIMHARGTPQTMQRNPRYRNLIEEVRLFLSRQLQKAAAHGIPINRIAIDPGIGFGKTADHNLKILHRLDRFADLGAPVMVGPSRKSFIGRALDLPPAERLEGTAAAVAIAVFQGANILRVHDVASLARVIRVAHAIRKEEMPHD